jgi:O-antigen ligase
MSRTALVLFAFSGAPLSVFVRSKKGLFCSLLITAVLILVLPGPVAGAIQNRFPRALRYDFASDGSAVTRAQSMRESWQQFIDHPIIGVGANQSPTVIEQGSAHQLAIWQATEDGVLAFLGVLIITAACVVRVFELLRVGATTQLLRLEFAFIFGPAMYFVRGLFADVPVNITVVNTWICLVFAMLAIADAQTMKRARSEKRPAKLSEDCSSLREPAEAGSRTLMVE